MNFLKNGIAKWMTGVELQAYKKKYGCLPWEKISC